MKKLAAIGIVALALAWATSALAQSNPGLRFGQVPTAAQWNSYFSAKADYLGYTPLNPSNLLGTAPITVTPAAGVLTIACPTCLVPGSSPTLTGTWTFNLSPLVPTATLGDSSTKAASTAFVQAAIAPVITPKLACDGTTDDAPAINAAIVTAAAANGGTVLVNCHLTKWNSTVSSKYPNVYVKGLGGGTNNSGCTLAGTQVTWGGAGGGTMAELKADPSALEPAGGGFSGFCFEANSSAGIGLSVSSRHFCTVDDIWVDEATIAGIQLTANVSLGNYSNQNCQFTNIGGREVLNAAPGLLFTGITGPAATASYNSLTNLYFLYKNAPAIQFVTGDNNVLYNVQTSRGGGGSAYCVSFEGSNTSGFQSSDNKIYGLSCPGVASIFKGTSSYTYPTNNNRIYDIDSGNNTPEPVQETVSSGFPDNWWTYTAYDGPKLIVSDQNAFDLLANSLLSLATKTNTAKRLSFGYNLAANVAWIQASNYGVSFTPLKIQREGGDLYLGNSAGTIFSSGPFALVGSTSGQLTQTVAAAAGTPTIAWGTGSGTPAVSASSPLAIATATGNITCATCTTSAAALTANQLVIGSGSQSEQTLGSLGTTTTVLHGNAAGAPTFGAVANADLVNSATTVNGQTCTLGSSCTVTAVASSIVVGTTTIGGGTTTRILYDNAGTLGEYTITGSGTVVAMQTSPTFVTDLTTPIAKLSGTSNQLVFQSGGVTGTISWAPTSTNKTLTLPNGTTDFTGTGGTSQVVKQTSAGGAFTVARLACADLSDAAATCSSASGESLVIGTTAITSGTTTRILYDNAGVLGEYTISGSGTVVAMAASPIFTGPTLGIATGTSLAIGGGSIGSDALEVTGTTTHNGTTTVAGASFTLSGNISAAAWTTTGIRYQNVAGTLTDTTSSGTVATAYTNVYGGSTIAASAATTFTNYFNTYFNDPVAGTNVTMTNKWAMGADSAKFGTSNQLTISTAGVLTATSPVFITPALGTPSSGVGTNITNVNAATLGGATFAAPGAIGGGTPSSGAFTTVTASTSITATAANSLTTIAVRSGATGSYSALSIGRTSDEAHLAIATGAGSFTTNTQAGDLIVQSNSNSIFFSVGGVSLEAAYINTVGMTFQTKMFAPNLATTTEALGAALCWTATTGEFQRDTNAGGCLISSGRYKHDVRPLGDALSIVMAAKPVSFLYNDDVGIRGPQVGFIAEDMAALDERLVGRYEDGSVSSVRYMQYTAVLTRAFQQLKSANDNLRVEVDELKRKVAR